MLSDQIFGSVLLPVTQSAAREAPDPARSRFWARRDCADTFPVPTARGFAAQPTFLFGNDTKLGWATPQVHSDIDGSAQNRRDGGCGAGTAARYTALKRERGAGRGKAASARNWAFSCEKLRVRSLWNQPLRNVGLPVPLVKPRAVQITRPFHLSVFPHKENSTRLHFK